MKFNKKSVILLLENLRELREGIPIEQHLSYLERPLATSSRGDHAPFENPCMLIGELERRLAKCGRDGFLVKARYAIPESEEALAKSLGLSLEEVQRGIETALKYISKKGTRGESYQEFKWRKKQVLDT